MTKVFKEQREGVENSSLDNFVPAEKSKTYLRLFISGPTGTGKTYSALKLAKGIKEKTDCNIAVIDTEHGKSTLNANWVDFDINTLEPPYEVEDYINAVHRAAGKYGVLIIDSLSHAWQNILMRIDEIIEENHKENYRAWGKKGEGTDLQNLFVETLLSYPGHLISSCRSKMKHEMRKIGNRMSVVKLGIGNIQRDGVEYEFDFIMEATEEAIENHTFEVTKDRTGKYQAEIVKPDEELGIELLNWLSIPEGDFITVDFPDVRKLKKKIKHAISFFDEGKANELVKDNYEDWEDSHSIEKLEEFLNFLRLQYRKK